MSAPLSSAAVAVMTRVDLGARSLGANGVSRQQRIDTVRRLVRLGYIERVDEVWLLTSVGRSRLDDYEAWLQEQSDES